MEDSEYRETSKRTEIKGKIQQFLVVIALEWLKETLSIIFVKEFRTITVPWILFILSSIVYITVLCFAVFSQIFRLTLPFKNSQNLTYNNAYNFQKETIYLLEATIRPRFAYNLVYVGLFNGSTQFSNSILIQSFGYVRDPDYAVVVQSLIPYNPSDSDCNTIRNQGVYRVRFFYYDNLHLPQKCNRYPTRQQHNDSPIFVKNYYIYLTHLS